jgi:hypothetical protein
MRTSLKPGRQFFRLALIITFLLSTLRLATPVQAITPVFVSPTGTGDCSQSSPCSLATGLTQVDPGGTLYAAAGTYTGSGDQVVLLNKTINFLGGWNSAPSGPVVLDPDLYESILDGEDESGRRVMTISGGASVQPLVDGWTIRNGNAGKTVEDPDCHAHAGHAYGCGGGIFVYEAQPTISHNLIMLNTALVQIDSIDVPGNGGGIYVDSSAGTIISGNTIRENNSQTEGDGWGAGIYIYNSGGTTAIFDNDIFGNEYSASIGDNHFGGGIMIYDNAGQIRIYNNYIHDNDPLDQGFYGTAIGFQYCDNDVIVEDNTITGNFGDTVIGLSYSSPIIQQNTIINPGAKTGIIFNDTSPGGTGQPARIYNNIIANHAQYNIYNLSLLYEETYAEFIHNTLANAPYGLYIYNLGTGSLSFDRGIISGHSVAGVVQTGSTGLVLSVSNTLFYGNGENGQTGDDPIFGDPLFVNAASGDYHLQVLSAAIDTVTDGGVAEDIDGDARPSSGRYDVGADEYFWPNIMFLPSILRP